MTTGQAHESKFSVEEILAKVRGLIALAEGASTEQEAEAARAKAEQLMARYRIAEEEIIAQDPTSVEPIHRTIDISTIKSSFYQRYLDIFATIAQHCGIRAHYEWDLNNRTVLVARVIGYESDIRYAEMLFTNAQMVFSNRLEPGVNPILSDAENVYRLRSAGIERNKIARMMWRLDTHAAHARVGTLYRQACQARGEDATVSGRTVSAKTYRQAYSRQFRDALYLRLHRAQDAAGAIDGTMVLVGREERVDEAFYTAFPQHRPAPEQAEDPDAKKSRKSGWTKADQERWDRQNYSAAGLAGRAAGQSAAAEVSLREPARQPGLDRYTETEREETREVWGAIGGQ